MKPLAFFWRQRARVAFYGAILALGLLSVRYRHELLRAFGAPGWERYRSVASVVAEHRGRVEAKWAGTCRDGQFGWPPDRLFLLAFKDERTLEVWAARDERRVLLGRYPILGMSGGLGPKRRAGDLQVPEGYYRLSQLNANSGHHLSIRVDYPNPDDLAHAVVPWEQMGTDIYIHGGKASLGCLAMGDPAIEELFTLVSLVGVGQAELWISPVDFRRRAAAPPATEPWIADVYARLSRDLAGFSRPEDSSRGSEP